MICQHCGATLPPIAMFCGECGRSVAARGPVVPLVALSSAAMPFSASEPLSITPATPPEPDDALSAQPTATRAAPASAAQPTATHSPASPISPPAPPVVDDRRRSEALRPASGGCPRCGTPPEPGDLFCGTCGEPLAGAHSAAEETVASPAVASPVTASSPSALAATPAPAAPAMAPAPPPAAPISSPPESTLEPDTENTRLVPRGSTGARFVLQFSTGESYTVLGSGIIGRNPSPEPGEVIDHIVTIVDPGRSVSKSHLEFGQDNGVFWVSDRHSGNGSVIREPGSEPRYCEPGRRYRVVRGTRIDIGEQFVVVS